MSGSGQWVKARAWRALNARSGWPIHLLLACLVLPRATFLGKALFERDLHSDWYPRLMVLASTIRQGMPPLWDLSIGFGQPLLGDPTAQVLYPTSWLALLLEPWTVYTLYALAHLTLAGAGATRLASAAGMRQPEAVVAGVAFMLGGPFVSLVNLWAHFVGAAWMPWIVVAVHHLARRPSLRSVLRLALCLGLQVLSGSGDMVVVTACLSAAWLAAVSRPLRLRHLVRLAWAFTMAIGLAAALSAGQWMPTLDLVRHGSRGAMAMESLTPWSVPPAGLARVILPLDATGLLDWSGKAQVALFGTPWPPFLASLFVGTAGAALAAAAVAGGQPRPLVLCLLLVGAGSALVALGRHGPVHALAVRFIPGAGQLRYPAKAMVLFGLCVAILAGLGVPAARRGRRARVIGAGVALMGAVALGATAVLLVPSLRTAIAWEVLPGRPGFEGNTILVAVRLMAHALVAVFVALTLLRAGRASAGGAPRWTTLWPVTASIAVELLLAHYDLHSTTGRELFAFRPPVLSVVDQTDRSRLYVYQYREADQSVPRPASTLPYVIQPPPAGFDPRPLVAWATRIYPLPPLPGYWGLEGSWDLDMRGLQSLPLWGLNMSLRSAEGTPAHKKLLRLGAVTMVVALHREGFEDLQPGPEFPSLFPEPVRTFRVPDALARARLVGRARALEGRAALEALFDPAFDPATEVILSGPGAREAAAGTAGSSGRVRIEELRGDRVRLEVETDQPSLVAMADAWDPGWRAWVDGRPAEVLCANVAFRAVAVPAGRHWVEMRYRPRAAIVGLLLTAAGLVVLAGAYFSTRSPSISTTTTVAMGS